MNSSVETAPAVASVAGVTVAVVESSSPQPALQIAIAPMATAHSLAAVPLIARRLAPHPARWTASGRMSDRSRPGGGNAGAGPRPGRGPA
ncbi:MAG: hypothetical protein BroJett022_09460 [Actinomycetes bacterium]|nr:MAG: hypothetical protein BroJett022_09460 [Actinomycetes bacterium]